MGNTIPTLKHIAEKLNFSISTVSRALKNHPSIGLRTTTQVQQLARELGYEPNKSALLFKQQKTKTIGVIIPNLMGDFFSIALNGIEDTAKIKGYSVLLGQTHDEIEQEKEIVNAMKNHRVDGLVISMSKQTKYFDHLTNLKKYNIPVVFFDRVPDRNDVHKVASNCRSGTKQAVEFLISRGHRRIAVLNGPDEMASCRERVEAYLKVLKDKKIKADLSLIKSADLTREQTFQAMSSFLRLKDPPTAVLAINDYVAMDAIQYARKGNLKINRDICFVSYGNLSITNYLEYPPLASVEQFPYEQAQKAAEILFNLLDSPLQAPGDQVTYQHVLIEGRLVIREK